MYCEGHDHRDEDAALTAILKLKLLIGQRQLTEQAALAQVLRQSRMAYRAEPGFALADPGGNF